MHSQSDYPKRLVIDGDTVIAITPEQRDSIMEVYYGYDECAELTEIHLKLIENSNKQRALMDSIINMHRYEKAEYIEVIELNQRINISLNQSLRKQKLRNNALIISTGVCMVGLTGAVVLLLMK